MRFIFLTFILSVSLHAFSLLSSEIGGKLTRYNYAEYNQEGVILDSEISQNSPIFGVYLINEFDTGFKHRKIELKNDYSTGTTTYTGFPITGGSYGDYISFTQNTFLHNELLFLFEAWTFQEVHFDLYITWGHRYWERTLSVSQNEIYHWFYNGAGFRATLFDKEGEKFIIDAGAYLAHNPKMFADIPPIDLVDTFNLGTTYRFYAIGKYTQKMFSDQLVSLAFEYEYLHINRSNSITVSTGTYTEPESFEHNLHVYAGFIFYGL